LPDFLDLTQKLWNSLKPTWNDTGERDAALQT
jgi:hypothetical protein